MTDPRIEFHEHPEYKTLQDSWRVYRALYTGDRAELVKPHMLWPHELESSQQPIASSNVIGVAAETVGQRLRRIRSMRSRYLNLIEPVVSNWIAMAFSKGIQIDDEVRGLFGEEELNDVDGHGTALETFVTNQIAIAYFRDGKAIVRVDAPANDARSRAEERAKGFRPYMEVLDVLAVRDWQSSDNTPRGGGYDWLRCEYTVIEPREDPTEKPKEILYCDVLTRTEVGVTIEVFEHDEERKGWAPVGEPRILSGWGEIPVSVNHGNESWLRDVAEQQLVLYNLMSANYNGLNAQAFQRIFIAGDLGDKHLISINEYAIGQLPTGATVEVIQPSDNSALSGEIAGTIDNLFRVAFNRSRNQPSDSKEAPGANTLREMQAELVALLKQALIEIEDLTNHAIRHYAMFKLGPEAGGQFRGRVTLNKDVTVADVAHRLEMFAAYRDEIRKVLPWRKAELKRAAGEMGYGEDETREIVDEIDALKDEPPFDPLQALRPFARQQQQQQQNVTPREPDGRDDDPASGG